MPGMKMASFKFLLPYSICAIVILLYQNNCAYALTECYSCSSNSTEHGATCNNSEIVNTTGIGKCINPSNCGTYTLTDSNGVYTFRGCNITCDTLKEQLYISNSSNWACTTCDDANLCNGRNITVPSSATTIGINLVPLLLTTIAALNCY